MGRALLRTSEVREIEQAALVGRPPGALMQLAGEAAARRVDARLAGRDAPVLVLCGPGNNGGDGYVCAAALQAAGRPVRCWAPLAPATSDARAARERYVAAGGAFEATLPPAVTPALCVDAMFGIGFTRPLGPPFADAADWLGTRTIPVIALDIPSGLDADRGCWLGGRRGIRADQTVTFLVDKIGLHTLDGVDAAGEVFVETLGVDPEPRNGRTGGAAPVRLLDAAELPALARARDRNTHKGTFGDVRVVGGGIGMVGAVLLAARAALRLGAGRVFVECIGAPELRLDPMQPELMFRARDAGPAPAADAIVVGCGLGRDGAAAAALGAALEQRCGVLVVDADGLNLIAEQPALRERFIAAGTTRATVITPHPLEAARLLGRDIGQVQADRVASARELARTLGAITVLKGAGSIVAAPSGAAWINSSGSPALATPGSGDVLSGIAGALAAQLQDPLQAVLAAVWLHGAAADLHGADSGLVAGEIALLASQALRQLRATTLS